MHIWRERNIMVNVIVYLGVLALGLYTAILYGSHAMVILTFAGMAFLILAYVLLIYQYFQIKATILVPIATAEPGQSVDVELRADNCGKLPVLKLGYEIRWKNFMQRRGKKVFLKGSVDAGGKGILRTDCAVKAAGNYRLQLERIRIYDLTGIFYIGRRINQEAAIWVLPKQVQMNVRVGQASRHFVGESDVYDDAKGGYDPSEVFQIREFRPGDKIQSIHWKLSAKAEELMVRENSQPLGCPVVLLADAAGIERFGISGMEHFLQTVYSVSFLLVEQKCPHYIAWECGKDREIRRVRVQNEEGIYLFLMDFFASGQAERKRIFLKREKGKETEVLPENLRGRYREKYRAETYITDVAVDGSLEVSVNGAFVGRLGNGTFEADCEKLELIV